MFEDTASALFGVAGLQVTSVEAASDGGIEVWAVTAWEAARTCPDCGTVSDRVHETVVTRPRDVRRASETVHLRWVKYRRKCGNPGCPRQTFTESVPAVPPRCRITARLREQAAHEIGERGITPAEAARHAGISWPSAHDAFVAAADPLLDQPAAPVAHLGIDEHRRAGPDFAVDEQIGEYTLLADRWHTCFFDLDGQHGLLGQVEGRTADDAAYWLADAPRPGGTRGHAHRWTTLGSPLVATDQEVLSPLFMLPRASAPRPLALSPVRVGLPPDHS